MRKIPYLKYSITLLLTLSVVTTGIMSISSLVYAQSRSIPLEDRLVNSYPVSYEIQKNVKDYAFELKGDKVYKKNTNNELFEVNFNEGIYDKSNSYFYYTKKSVNSWGSEKYIYVYSFSKNKVVKSIEFDNSGYHKFPIAISPDSKKLVLAERSQSIGETNLIVIDIRTGRTTHKIEKAYSPSGTWIDNNTIAYLKTRDECLNNFCKQIGINLNVINITTKEIRFKEVAKSDEKGKLPNLDKISYLNNNLELSSRSSSFNTMNLGEIINVDLNFN